MTFLTNLLEKLETQMIYTMKGKYETHFKVGGVEYALIANSIGGDCQDNTQWMLDFENVTTHRIGVNDNNPKVAKAFAEAVDQWIKERNPHCFFTYGSHIDSLKSIIEAVKKKSKKYNIIDDTADKKNEDTGEVIPGNPIGKITWTKMIEQEVVPTADREALVADEFEKTYEEPTDIKANKEYMSGTSKTDKLDKGDKAYNLKTESTEEESRVDYFVKKFRMKMKGSTKQTAYGWVDGIKELSDDEKKQVKEKIRPFIKEGLSFDRFKAEKFGLVIESDETLEEALKADELIKKSKSVLKKFKEKFGEPFKKAIEVASDPEKLKTWMDQNKEDFLAALEIVKHMVDKKELSFEEEILKGIHINEGILDVFAKKTPNALIAAAIILMASGAGNRAFAKNNVEDAFKKAKENIEKVVEIVKKETGESTEKIKKEVGKGLDKAEDKAEEIGKDVSKEVEKNVDKIKDNIPSTDEVGDKIKDKSEEIKKGFKDFIQKKKEEKEENEKEIPVKPAPKPPINTMEV